jgi:hypothetical protein
MLEELRMKKLLALLAVLGLSSIASAALNSTPSVTKTTTEVTNSFGTFEKYMVKLTSDGTNKFSGLDLLVDGTSVLANIAGWTPVYGTTPHTYSWDGTPAEGEPATTYYDVVGATPLPSVKSSSGADAVTGLYTSGLWTGKIGAQEATFVGATAPTYTFVADDSIPEVRYDANGGSTTGLATHFRVASAITTDTLSNVVGYVYILKGTSAVVSIQGTNGAGVKTDWYTQTIPEPATMSLLAMGLVGLLRRKLA